MNQPPPTTARLSRLVLVVSVVAVSITMVVASIVMNSSLGPKVVIPGPLSAQHALLTENCVNCHSAEMDSTKGILHGMVNSDLSLRDSNRCLECHDLGEHPLQAHALSETALEWRTQRVAERPVLAENSGPSGIVPPHSDLGEYACAVCHVEHEGRRNDLKAMTDGQCQSCHSVRFGNFENGHPEFENYPYRRRLRIAFDHASHIYHDFLTNDKGLAPTSCTDCHDVDDSGAFMMTGSFEQTCAQCHDKDVRATARTGGVGVAFFALPAIDTMTLDDEGINIGQWPADSGVAEGALTPFMRLMLAGDARAQIDLRIIDSLDLLDLQGATDEELAAVGRFAWSIKSMAEEIAVGGHGAIAGRLRGVAPSETLSASLAGGLTRSLVRECISAWFPDLANEMTRHASGDDPLTDILEDVEFAEIDATGRGWSSSGGWYRDDMAFALKYRPTGHGDVFLRSWADLAAGHPLEGRPLLNAFAGANAVGECLKCHSVDQAGDGTLNIQWRAGLPEDVSGGLTRFEHAPHLPLLDDDGCLQCHVIEPQPRSFGSSYEQHDPSIFVSAMASMTQAKCAECHTPKKVATSCLDCHDYHAQRPTTRLRAGAPLKPIKQSGKAMAEEDAAPIE